jgi:hypothetical protein
MGLSNGLNTLHAAGAGAGAVGGWVELARTTLGSGSSEISVASLADKRYYMTLLDGAIAGAADVSYRYNSDTGANYAGRKMDNGGAVVTHTNTNYIFLENQADARDFSLAYHANLAGEEKLVINHWVSPYSTGSGNAPNRAVAVGKWANTSNAINEIIASNGGSGSYASGSELVVLGWDTEDTHTNNFWEELASVDISSTGDLDSGTFTAKKYLWVQVYVAGLDTSTSTSFKFNSDTGSNYSVRRSYNSGADWTGTSRSILETQGNIASILPHFANMFIINNSANEKLGIMHNNLIPTAGVGTAPSREETAFKWANTSSQITKITVDKAGFGGGLLAGSKIRVWGSN